MPAYYFQINEIRETAEAPGSGGHHGRPSYVRGANVVVDQGASHMWWFCDGRQIHQMGYSTPNAQQYSTYSVFYSEGFGFWVLKDDAVSPRSDEAWKPLCFDHVPYDNYSSYLCNAAQNRTVAYRRDDQAWLSMLLPNIYYESVPVRTNPAHGGLKGELALFLALVAFAIRPDMLQTWLPHMFLNGSWIFHDIPHGRQKRRGVTVHVYNLPGHRENLANYEKRAKYFN